MSIDKYFDRRFDRTSYDCLHFTREVWLDLTGHDLADSLDGLLGASAGRTVSRRHPERFTRLAAPESPCLAFMQRPRSTPHVGIYLRRRILHIQETGVEFQPVDVAMRGFSSIRYYRCNA